MGKVVEPSHSRPVQDVHIFACGLLKLGELESRLHQRPDQLCVLVGEVMKNLLYLAGLVQMHGAGAVIVQHLEAEDQACFAKVGHLEAVMEYLLDVPNEVLGRKDHTIINVDGQEGDVLPVDMDVDAGLWV